MKNGKIYIITFFILSGCGHQPTTLYTNCHDTNYEFYNLKVCNDERNKTLKQSIAEKLDIEKDIHVSQEKGKAQDNGLPWYFWALLPLSLFGSAADIHNAAISNTNYQAGGASYTNTITPEAYGPGTHMNQYGQPIKLNPSDYSTYGYYGDSYIKTPNAYGPGIHMDQYGRPVSIQSK